MTMAAAYALELSGVEKRFGATEIIRGVSLGIARGERHAIIGPNGAGKSTLFNLISGRYAPTRGSIRLDGEDVTGLSSHRIAAKGVARSFQIMTLFDDFSARDNVMVGLPELAVRESIHRIERALANLALRPSS